MMKCTACQVTEVLPGMDPCWGCVKARAKTAFSHRCTCPAKLKRPRTIVTRSRSWLGCDRCLGSIRNLN